MRWHKTSSERSSPSGAAAHADDRFLGELARRSARLAGARLLQASLEHAAEGGPHAPAVPMLLALAVEVLERPDRLAATLGAGARP